MKSWLTSIPDPVVVVLFTIAALFVLRAVHLAYGARKFLDPPGSGLPELISLMRAFRALVVGVLIIGFAAGAALGSTTVFWVVTAICAEELYESSMALWVMRRKFATEGH